MRITIKFKDKTEITIFNVYDIEQCNFDLHVKQLNQKFTYALNKFELSKIDKVIINCLK